MDQYLSLPSYSGPCYGVLELCLKDILSCIKPSENDQLKRQYTISELTTLVQSVENLKDVVVRPFGSFTSNLYTKWGDLDISVELSHSSPSSTANIHKQSALRGVMEVLQRNGVACNFNFIPNASVPLLKFESNHHNISCDVSVDNHVGWMKSKILLLISEVDERCRDMVLLTKEWAKAHHINHSKSGTLNSYSLCLLVIFFFQTCKPAILPPLKDIYEGNFYDLRGTWSTLERQIEYACAANIARFKSLRQINQSTLCQLLISFFDKFSEIERISSEYAICTYTGQLERKDSNHRWMEKSYSLLVEDPFERPDNAARAVGFRGLVKISEAFKRTSLGLSSYSLLSDRNALLARLVRTAAAALMLENENHKFMGRPRVERDFIGMINLGSRKIYLTYPSDSTFSEEDVSNYFSVYGPVQDVRIPYQQKRMFGFVTFVYPETVNLILARGNPHFVCNARVLVKPYKEKGKIPDKKQQHDSRFDFSGCTTPTGLDSRDPFDLQQLASPRMMYGGNNHEVLLRRKMEGQQAIKMQRRRFMGLQLLDIKNRSLVSPTAPILSPVAIPNSTTFNNTKVFSDAGSSSNGRPDGGLNLTCKIKDIIASPTKSAIVSNFDSVPPANEESSLVTSNSSSNGHLNASSLQPPSSPLVGMNSFKSCFF